MNSVDIFLQTFFSVEKNREAIMKDLWANVYITISFVFLTVYLQPLTDTPTRDIFGHFKSD